MNKQDYLALVEKRKQEKAAAGAIVEVAMPSGATWQMLPVNIAQYAVSAQLPTHLLAKLPSVANAPVRELSEDETTKLGLAALTIARDVMLNNLIFPKITLEETPDSITPEQIDPEDFDYFLKFIMQGAQADANSKSGRKTPRK